MAARGTDQPVPSPIADQPMPSPMPMQAPTASALTPALTPPQITVVHAPASHRLRRASAWADGIAPTTAAPTAGPAAERRPPKHAHSTHASDDDVAAVDNNEAVADIQAPVEPAEVTAHSHSNSQAAALEKEKEALPLPPVTLPGQRVVAFGQGPLGFAFAYYPKLTRFCVTKVAAAVTARVGIPVGICIASVNGVPLDRYHGSSTKVQNLFTTLVPPVRIGFGWGADSWNGDSLSRVMVLSRDKHEQDVCCAFTETTGGCVRCG